MEKEKPLSERRKEFKEELIRKGYESEFMHLIFFRINKQDKSAVERLKKKLKLYDKEPLMNDIDEIFGEFKL